MKPRPKRPERRDSNSPQLEGIPDEVLQAELKRREEERKAERQNRLIERQQLQRSAMTLDVINAFLPKHGRTSCSDQDTGNGWGSNGMNQLPRCDRCAAIELMNGSLPDGEFIFRLRPELAGKLEDL